MMIIQFLQSQGNYPYRDVNICVEQVFSKCLYLHEWLASIINLGRLVFSCYFAILFSKLILLVKNDLIQDNASNSIMLKPIPQQQKIQYNYITYYQKQKAKPLKISYTYNQQMQAQQIQNKYKSRLVISVLLSLSIWLIGFVCILISITLIFSWLPSGDELPDLRLRPCSDQFWVRYLRRSWIHQYVCIAGIGVATLLVFVCFFIGILEVRQLGTVQSKRAKEIWETNRWIYRSIYPLLIFISIILTLVSLLIAIKLYLGLRHLILTPSLHTCTYQYQLVAYKKKLVPLIIVIILLSLIIILEIVYYLVLPYRYLCGGQSGGYGWGYAGGDGLQLEAYNNGNELYKKQQGKVAMKQPRSVQQDVNTSNQELLLQSVIKQKQTKQIGITVDIISPVPLSIPVLAKQKQEKKVDNKKLTDTGVGDNSVFAEKEVVIKKNVVKTVSIGTGNNTTYKTISTDCHDLPKSQSMPTKPLKNQIAPLNPPQNPFKSAQPKVPQTLQIRPPQSSQSQQQPSIKTKRSLMRTETKQLHPELLTLLGREAGTGGDGEGVGEGEGEGSDCMVIVQESIGYYYLEYEREHTQQFIQEDINKYQQYIANKKSKLPRTNPHSQSSQKVQGRQKYFISGYKKAQPLTPGPNPHGSQNPSKLKSKNNLALDRYIINTQTHNSSRKLLAANQQSSNSYGYNKQAVGYGEY